ncbi:hypothetical protein [Streptomyces sp. MAR25Y5]|uniref:hypothetical protein n=1 Tax=Streptomyces sp. MAR25Y5 TaxID=2962028 RepID=UPI0020B8F417|nr:hypothetical protein [Streptomyces sp. MAR25Y5]MCP3766446.1 hypothetical protein [Streptomyces sp. MAR25Y5]
MNVRTRAARAVFTTSAIAAAAMLFSTQAAVAATDDSFEVSTTDGQCGVVNFIDYGPGHEGGGNNDDYLVIHDYCSDGKGVRAYAMHNGKDLGSKTNTNGLAGKAVVWDPFGNVQARDRVGVAVCLVNSSGALSQCVSVSRESVDG